MGCYRFERAACGTLLVAALALFVAGCANEQLTQLRHQVQMQGAELKRQGKEIEALRKAQSVPAATASAQTGQPACDRAVLKKALDQGDQQVAFKQPQIAAFYYRDALGACPGDAQAALKLARIYEQLGARTQAVAYYRLAAKDKDSAPAREARQALARLRAH